MAANKDPLSSLVAFVSNWKVILGAIVALVTFGAAGAAIAGKYVLRSELDARLAPVNAKLEQHGNQIDQLQPTIEDARDEIRSTHQDVTAIYQMLIQRRGK